MSTHRADVCACGRLAGWLTWRSLLSSAVDKEKLEKDSTKFLVPALLFQGFVAWSIRFGMSRDGINCRNALKANYFVTEGQRLLCLEALNSCLTVPSTADPRRECSRLTTSSCADIATQNNITQSPQRRSRTCRFAFYCHVAFAWEHGNPVSAT